LPLVKLADDFQAEIHRIEKTHLIEMFELKKEISEREQHKKELSHSLFNLG
jgi:hypothetical protein